MRSTASPPLSRMPCSAAFPVATTIAVGVARPRAQGHAMMSTLTNVRSAYARRGSGPKSNQTTNVAIAMSRTVGTKIPATVSARRWIGALRPCASRTRRTICASVVLWPVRLTRKVNAPVRLTVAPITESPGRFSTGRGSPVSMLSSTADAPSMSVPSSGTRSPGRTTTASPTVTSATGTSISRPSRTTRAVSGCNPISLRTAAPVCPFARSSSARPPRMSVMMTAAAS